MTSTRTSPQLLDALYELSLAQDVPDAALLDEMVARYPEHAEALTAFAVELALDSHFSASPEVSGETAKDPVNISPAVSRAMSRFQNRLHAVKHEQAGTKRASPSTTAVVNPFLSLDKAAFRALAERLHATTIFVAKLRDRQIDPQTMTDGFRRRVSTELQVPTELIAAHFAAPQQAADWKQLYKADEKPIVGPCQTFADAVKSSGLSEEQQQYLLKL